MKKIRFIVCTTIVSALFYQTSLAQDSTEEKGSSNFKIGVSYLSDNVYMGRKDSAKIPYLTPTIGYYHKSGLFFTASASYLSTEKRIDAYTLDAGYSFSSRKWEGEISAEKSIYSDQSYSVKSEVLGSASASIAYDANWIKPSFNGSLSFGNTIDYAASLGMEHTFFALNDNMDITPSLMANASTENYYDSYYHKRKYAKTRKGKTVPFDITANTLGAANFKILDYEASLPINYTVKGFTFNFTPTAAMPVNPNSVMITVKSGQGSGQSRTFVENIGTTFFWALGLTYQL
jgi:outer membrane scaffolding protein for murein synthesis (MipA/OmpV family)